MIALLIVGWTGFVQAHAFGATRKAQERLEEDLVIIRILQTMRCILHTAELLGTHACVFQSHFAKFKMLLPVANLLNSDNAEVVRESLALLAALLRNGNLDGQKNFFDHFKSTREETFFVDVSERIKLAMNWIREVGTCTCMVPSIELEATLWS